MLKKLPKTQHLVGFSTTLFGRTKTLKKPPFLGVFGDGFPI
jgi:hypothetical protein